jgi:syntaxin-binding protein 1
MILIFLFVFLGGWKVLVMDRVATRVISSALTMYDIMERRVTIVEKLEINRQPFQDMDVIYLASPTADNARRISADFENRQKAKYGHVHIFFLEAVSCTALANITPFLFFSVHLGWK